MTIPLSRFGDGRSRGEEGGLAARLEQKHNIY
jgi:hypothetical protein